MKIKFFTVTETSVYSVSDERDKKGRPIVEKIALRGKSKIPVGGRLTGGKFVGIMQNLVLYNQDHSKSGGIQRPDEIDSSFEGGHTSYIIALFLNKDEAMACSGSENLKMFDPRWRKQTEEVLRVIGNKHHPVFILPRNKKLGIHY